MFDTIRAKGFEVVALHHAEAILEHDMRSAQGELEEVLVSIRLPIGELVRGGGGEGELTQRLRRSLESLGWKKHNFEVIKTIDGRESESLSHTIDHVKRFKGGSIALEIEWNNKDPFFDRDLDTFKRLHADGAISIGAIVTRGTSLQDGLRDLVAEFARSRRLRNVEQLADLYTPTPRQRKLIERAAEARGSFADGWAHAFVSDKFGEATTHWRKLDERVRRGVGNPCPLLLIGIPLSVVVA
jgi:Restriction endonuclease BglII